MILEIPDVDLDVKDRDRAVTVLKGTTIASQVATNGRLAPHNTGIYLQRIPKDPVTDLSAFPYKEAEWFGYYKIDIIANHVYDMVGSNDELDELLEEPIDWDWFLNENFFDKSEDPAYRLTHISNYLWLCQKYPPQSVEDLAALIAVVRPGKSHLIGQPWETVKEEIWKRDGEGYVFKKSHAVAFALLVTVHAKLINRKLSESVDG